MYKIYLRWINEDYRDIYVVRASSHSNSELYTELASYLLDWKIAIFKIRKILVYIFQNFTSFQIHTRTS